MSDNTMPEILWAQYNRDDDTSVQYNAWSTRNEKFVETEYIRADIAQAQIDAANKRIIDLEHELAATRSNLLDRICTLLAEREWMRGIAKTNGRRTCV